MAEFKLTAIVLSCTKNADLLQMHLNMLESFKENSPADAQMIVLENNSDPVLREEWKQAIEAAGYRYEFVDGPFNMNKLYNYGTGISETDFVCYCNSDIIFFPNWAEGLLKKFEADDELVCVTPFSELQIDEENYRWPRFRDSNDLEPKDELVLTSKLAPWCYCFKKSFVVDVMHGWDENFTSFFQDNDISMFLEKGGYKSGVSLDSRVDHLGNQTYKLVPDQNKAEFDTNKEIFESKWSK